MIVGIDEVGRGAWAGPLVVGAVLLGGEQVAGLTDSKKLTKKQRERLDLEIRQKARSIGLGWVSAKEIDSIGLSEALKLAARKALSQISGDYKEIIIDGTVAFIDGERVTTMAKADLLVPSVSAASIVAKVARDRYMMQMDDVFPGYRFGSHVGYGTVTHRQLLQERGASALHRLSFDPLKQYSVPATTKDDTRPKTTKTQDVTIGAQAETAVSIYLQLEGHTILDRNWRTKSCEIDIVSRRADTVYFTEVKYRKSDDQGGGLAAITAKKVRQMKYAAEYYIHTYKLSDTNVRLAAADVTGNPLEVVSFLELS